MREELSLEPKGDGAGLKRGAYPDSYVWQNDKLLQSISRKCLGDAISFYLKVAE